MGGAGVNYYFLFNNPVQRFGGYWGTNADVPGATATFFDSLGNQIGSAQSIQAPLGQWAWDGWQSTIGFSRVNIVASNSFGGFIDSDDLQMTPFAVPEPSTIAVLILGVAAATRLRRNRKSR